MRAFNIADLFELTASCVADRTALVAGPTRLGYVALDERANRYKIPRRVVAVDEIRYTPQGKSDLAWADAAASHGIDR